MMRKGIDVFRDADGRTFRRCCSIDDEVEIDVDNKHKYSTGTRTASVERKLSVSKLLLHETLSSQD